MTIEIKIMDFCSNFAEDKDIAKAIREDYLKKHITSNEKVILNFNEIDSSTQSFIHALISEIFQKYGETALELIEFKNCNVAVRSLIATVINYSLE